jgi:hypothetical protein
VNSDFVLAMNLDIARDQFKSKFPSHSVIINTSFSDAISQLPLKGLLIFDPVFFK